jgi:uncharacterized spore protein YtfJ
MTERQGERVAHIADRIFAATAPGVVFGQPITAGNFTVITACEVVSGGGFGSGSGFGRNNALPTGSGETTTDRTQQQANSAGGGGGMGGGGGAMSRPVAVITIGPDGVTIRPVYDLTKVALAGLAAVGTILAIWGRSRRR